ncbi:probable receptor-like protein kinase [Tanacetum coccineum]
MTEQESVKHRKSSFILPDQTCQYFTLADIQALTHDFDEALVIGRGGFGKVYKCTTKIGTVYEVAIKRLHTFINKLKSLFISKVDMMSSHAMESTYEIMARPVEKSSNQCWREFTIAEIVILTDTFEHEQCWVDERTYVPTERGTGLAIYVTREDLEMPELIPSSGERNFVELQLEKFNHPNLIKLLGYCLDKNEL